MTIIKNFTKMQELQISSTISLDSRIGALVSVNCYAGPVTMHFSMTPEQAIQMASALVAHATALQESQQ